VNAIRVLIAEDDDLLRQTLPELLARTPGIDVVAACRDGRQALIEALAQRPDILLTDLKMPTMDGIELIRLASEKVTECRAVVLTVHDDDDSLFGAIKAGAHGYVLKGTPSAQIADAIRAVHGGDCFLSAGLVARVLREFARVDRLRRSQRELFEALTRREFELLEQLSTGASNRQIAQRLYLSEKTVRNHVSAILSKLHVNSRVEAALKGQQHGLGAP
jgi:DNA-binding NarL/FixJ family response regulator